MADKMCRWYDYDSRDIPGLGEVGQGRREPLNHKPTRKKEQRRNQTPPTTRRSHQRPRRGPILHSHQRQNIPRLARRARQISARRPTFRPRRRPRPRHLPPREVEVGQRLQGHSRLTIPTPKHVLNPRLQHTTRPTHSPSPHTDFQRTQAKAPLRA
jgi:hypothetical protein